MLQDSEDESGVLGGENPSESGARPCDTAATGADGLALHHRLGVRTDTETARTDARLVGVHAEQDLSARPLDPQILYDIGKRRFRHGGRGTDFVKIIVKIQFIGWEI